MHYEFLNTSVTIPVRLLRTALLAACTALMLAAGGNRPAQADPTLELDVVGGLAGVQQYDRHEAPFWTRRLPEITAGRVHAQIVRRLCAAADHPVALNFPEGDYLKGLWVAT